MIKGLPVDQDFDAGRLGTVKVDGTEIILGDPLIFDETNINDYDF